MADFEIDVGFNTQDLEGIQDSINSAGNVSQQTQQVESSIAGGIKAAGVIALLKQLNIVNDSIGFILSIISTGIVALLQLFFNYIKPFFEDPFKYLLKFGIYLLNGIIGALESVTNAILNVVSFGEVDPVDFGRFDWGIIEQAYDDLKRVTDNTNSTSRDIIEAEKQYARDFKGSFLKKEELNIIREAANEAESSLLETYRTFIDTGIRNTEELSDTIIIIGQNFADKLGVSLLKVTDAIDRQIQRVSSRLGGAPTGFNSATNSYYTPSSGRNEQRGPQTFIRDYYNQQMGFKR